MTTFGVSGKLWRDSLMLYDRASRSLWSQVLGRSVAGPEKGAALEEVPSETTTWGAWRTRHPETLVLVRPEIPGSVYADYHRDPGKIGVLGTKNPDPRLPGKALVFGLERGKRAAAVAFDLLERHPVVNAEALGGPVAVFSPPGETAAAAYAREVAGRVLTFERAEGEPFTVRDRESGSTWSWATGQSLSGELAGRSLERIPGTAVYWGVWARFHPGSEVVGADGGLEP